MHKDNIDWILDNGLHCGNSKIKSPNWVSIGNAELIDKRASHLVSVGSGGMLNDYVPFYFTPFSPMMMNILNGRGGVKRRDRSEIVILVSDLYAISKLKLQFVFTNSHAYYKWAEFHTDLTDLNKIDWKIIQARDFRRAPDDPAKIERYQAEALIYQHCPVEALAGMVCYNDTVKVEMENIIKKRNLDLKVYSRQGWYL